MRLALQTREQHIRREKATSNICTAQVLLAVIAGFYAVWHGPDGLRRIARRVSLQARMLADAALRAGLHVRHDAFFDTFVVEDSGDLIARAAAAGYNFRRVDETGVGIALDETVTRDDLVAIAGLLGSDLSGAVSSHPPELLRGSAFLQQAAFNQYHAEHEMLRYLKRLEDKDIALNRSMIPLGSCTMKLNATAEMIAITLPGFRRRPSLRASGSDDGVSDRDPPAGNLALRGDRIRRRYRCNQTPARRANMPACW